MHYRIRIFIVSSTTKYKALANRSYVAFLTLYKTIITVYFEVLRTIKNNLVAALKCFCHAKQFLVTVSNFNIVAPKLHDRSEGCFLFSSGLSIE